MSTTVSQMEGLLNRDMELMEDVWRKVAMNVPVLPTPALQCTRIGDGSEDSLVKVRCCYYLILKFQGAPYSRSFAGLKVNTDQFIGREDDVDDVTVETSLTLLIISRRVFVLSGTE